MEALFCFPALRFDALSPYRDSAYCGASKPGKEKQKSDDDRSAILIIHKFKSFLSVFTPVMRNIWREVTPKMAKTFEARMPRIGIMEKREDPDMAAWTWRPASAAADARQLARFSVKSFQTLLPNYSDQMAQFVFDVAWHSHGVSDLLAQ